MKIHITTYFRNRNKSVRRLEGSNNAARKKSYERLFQIPFGIVLLGRKETNPKIDIDVRRKVFYDNIPYLQTLHATDSSYSIPGPTYYCSYDEKKV